MLDPKSAAQALRNWCDKRGVESGVYEFLQLLDDRNELYLLPAIYKELRRMQKDDADQAALLAETAQQLSKKQRNKLADAFGADTKQVTGAVKESQVAGVDVTYKGEQIRGSVAAQLSQLQEQLTSNL